MKKDFKSAFTMAEIIIAMTVIGVLAVITLPSLTSNIDDRNFAARRIALYSRLSQAVGVIDSLSDAGKYNADGTAATFTDIENNAAMAFILNKLSQGLKIESTCNASDITNCGMSRATNFYSIKGGGKFTLPEKFSGINSVFKIDNTHSTMVAAFTTKNGDSIAVYYNPDCLSSPNGTVSVDNQGNKTYSYKDMVCANFIYDLNGRKSPNMVGKDVGVGTILFSTGAEVIMPTVVDYTAVNLGQSAAMTKCAEEGYMLPSRNELISIALNEGYLYIMDGNKYGWSSTKAAGDATKGWAVTFQDNKTNMKIISSDTTTDMAYRCSYPLTSTK